MARAGLKKKVSSILEGSGKERPAPAERRGPPSSPVPSPAEHTQQAAVADDRSRPKPAIARSGKPAGVSAAGHVAAVKRILPDMDVSGGKRQRLMRIMAPVLFLALAVLLFRNLKSQSGGAKPQPVPQGTQGSEVLTASIDIDWPIPEPYPDTLRDPMEAAGGWSDSSQSDAKQLNLRGILYSERKPSAIIDSRIVHEGDMVQGVRVVKINKRSVEFEAAGRSWSQQVASLEPPRTGVPKGGGYETP